jgi:putative transcriptional regulator
MPPKPPIERLDVAVPSKRKPLSNAELAKYEATRDLAGELLQSVREMKAGRVHVVSSPVIEARKKTGLSQSQFAALMGVSVRTLQGWEQGRKQPSGAARTLLAIASTNPKSVAGGGQQVSGTQA